MSVITWSRVTALTAAALLLTACQAPAPSVSGTPGSTPSAAPSSASATPASSSAKTADTVEAVCQGGGTFEEKKLATSDGKVLQVAARGTGATVVVLLHQSTSNGMCDWAKRTSTFESAGHRVVLVDLCGFSRSTCKVPWKEQLTLTTEWARSAGATRVVLVGASLGGTVAVHTAQTVKADAVVSLSGPLKYEEGDIAKDGPTLTMPALFVFSRDDAGELKQLQEGTLAGLPQPHKQLVQAGSGHGYKTLADDRVKPAVLAWVAGTYS